MDIRYRELSRPGCWGLYRSDEIPKPLPVRFETVTH